MCTGMRRGRVQRELGHHNDGTHSGEVHDERERAPGVSARDRNESAGDGVGGPRVFLERNHRSDVGRAQPGDRAR